MEDALQQIQQIIAAGIDFIEISGGSYEDPKMFARDGEKPEVKSDRTAQREAYFLDFARTIRERCPDAILMVTGGFRSLAGMHAALAENACDLIGVARPAAVDPTWARKLLQEEKTGGNIHLKLKEVKMSWLMSKIPVRAIGAGAESDYYAKQIGRIGKGLDNHAP